MPRGSAVAALWWGFSGLLGDERRPTITTTLLIDNLSDTTTESDLVALFSAVGRVRNVKLPLDRATGKTQGFAYLDIGDPAGVERAVQRFDGFELEGSQIRVEPADTRGGAHGTKSGLWGAGHAGSRPKGSRRGARARKRGL